MDMNTNTMRLDHYLHDDEDAYRGIKDYVSSVLSRATRRKLVAAWLERRYIGHYEQLDERYIEWQELAGRFIAEIEGVKDEHLPRIVVALLDTGRVMHEECAGLSKGGQAALGKIEQWESVWLAGIASPGRPCTRADLVKRCRQAPSSLFLDALVAQQEALYSLASRAGGDDPDWNVGGEGYEAREKGAQALESTWWIYHAFLRKWVEANKSEVVQVFDQAILALEEVSRVEESYGVVDQAVGHLKTVSLAAFGPRD